LRGANVVLIHYLVFRIYDYSFLIKHWSSLLVLFKRSHRRVAWPTRDHLWRPPYSCLKDAATLRYQLLACWLQKLHAVQLINDVPPISLCRYLYLSLLLQTLGHIYRNLALPRDRCLHGLYAAHVRWINDLGIVGNMIPGLLKRPLP
jgi:hypothetical protein